MMLMRVASECYDDTPSQSSLQAGASGLKCSPTKNFTEYAQLMQSQHQWTVNDNAVNVFCDTWWLPKNPYLQNYRQGVSKYVQ